MKYFLIFISAIFLISFISADTTFLDNPNYFWIDGYQPPPSMGLGSPGGGSVPDLLGNGTLNFQNLSSNVTVPVIEERLDTKTSLWWIVIILLIILLYNLRDKEIRIQT